MKTLVIVPCGKRKIWDKNSEAGPTKARDVYTGSPFKVNREYAEKFGDPWVILFAKYGFLEPDQVISLRTIMSHSTIHPHTQSRYQS